MARTSLLQWTAPRLYKQELTAGFVFTTSATSANIIRAGHGLSVGDLITFQEVGTLQTPLIENKVYSVMQTVSSSLFGVTLDGINFIIITNDGSNDNTYRHYDESVILENFVIKQDTAQNRVFWHESIINNHREVVNANKMHWLLEFDINLFNELDLDTRGLDFDELFTYLYEDVYVSRCNIDASASIVIRDSNSDPVLFVMDKFETSFKAQSKFQEVLTIGLRSKDPIDMSKTV